MQSVRPGFFVDTPTTDQPPAVTPLPWWIRLQQEALHPSCRASSRSGASMCQRWAPKSGGLVVMAVVGLAILFPKLIAALLIMALLCGPSALWLQGSLRKFGVNWLTLLWLVCSPAASWNTIWYGGLTLSQGGGGLCLHHPQFPCQHPWPLQCRPCLQSQCQLPGQLPPPTPTLLPSSCTLALLAWWIRRPGPPGWVTLF